MRMTNGSTGPDGEFGPDRHLTVPCVGMTRSMVVRHRGRTRCCGPTRRRGQTRRRGRTRTERLAIGTVLLVTHTEAQHHVDGLVGGWFDSELTPRGHKQVVCVAAAVAERIGTSAVRLYSSDLRRAHQTARHIADRLGVNVTTDDRLRERSFGEAEGPEGMAPRADRAIAA